MNKSLFYGIPAALVLAALLAGCSQPTDDDDNSSSGGGAAPGSDLSYIAYAFGDGIDTVKAVNHIRLGDQELVIPKGKTLDLRTENVYIRDLSANSKIIAQGDIIFAAAQNFPKGLDFRPAGNSAKIIADRAFISKYVWIDYTHGDANHSQYLTGDWDNAGIAAGDRPSAGENAVIHANWQQIVIIDAFDNFKGYTEDKPGYIFTEQISNSVYKEKYLAIEAPASGIGGQEADSINKNAGGLRLYLVGEPVIINSPLTPITLSSTPNLSVYKAWKPKPVAREDPPEESKLSLFAVSGDRDGSLIVAGNADVQDGKVIAPGGFTVWGVVKNTGNATDTGALPITGDNTALTAWTARLNGASFENKVSLLGTVSNTFGQSVSFGGDVEITGPSTFNGANFKGTALFNGPATFIEGASVKFDKPVTFADNAYVHRGVEFFGKDLSPQVNKFYKKISGLSYSEIYAYFDPSTSENSVIEITDREIKADATFEANIVFSGDVTIGTEAAFNKSVTFEGDATFNKKVTFGTLAYPDAGSATTVTVIKGNATFTSGVTIDFGTTGTPGKSNNTVYIEEVDFQGGNEITGVTDLNFGNTESPSIQFVAGAFGADGAAGTTGGISIPAGGGMSFKDNALTFTGNGGTIGASLIINEGATVAVDAGGQVTLDKGLPFVLMQAAEDLPGAFTIEGAVELDHGAVTAKTSGAKVKASGGLLLNVPGDVGGYIPALSVDGAILDLSAGGNIVFAGSGSRIVLKNKGNLILNNGPYGIALKDTTTSSDATIIAGWNGGSASLLTGSLGTTAVGTAAGTLWSSGYPKTDGTTPTQFSNLLNKDNGFIFVARSAEAGSISVNESAIDVPGGSIAVFQREYGK